MTTINPRLAEDYFLEHYDYIVKQIAISLNYPTRRFSREHDEDYKQSLLIEVWKGLPKFDPSRASIRSFIDLIIRTRGQTVANYYRKLDHIQNQTMEYQTYED